MTPCDGTAGSLKWCCGVDTSCCNDASKVKTLPFEFRGAIPNTASASYNPFTASATSTSATSTATSNSDSGSSGLSTGAKAGIGVGAAIGGILLLALGFIIARRTAHSRHNAPQEHPGAMAGYAPPIDYHGLPPAVPEKTAYPHELEHRSRSELEYSPASPGLPNKHTPSYEMPT